MLGPRVCFPAPDISNIQGNFKLKLVVQSSHLVAPKIVPHCFLVVVAQVWASQPVLRLSQLLLWSRVKLYLIWEKGLKHILHKQMKHTYIIRSYIYIYIILRIKYLLIVPINAPQHLQLWYQRLTVHDMSLPPEPKLALHSLAKLPVFPLSSAEVWKAR